MRELDLQTRIVKDIRANGGYARKWASGFQVGMPDLIIVLPDLGTIFAEVKMIRLEQRLVKGQFYLKRIPITLKQILELKKINEAGGNVCILMGVDYLDWGRLYLLPWDTKELEIHPHNFNKYVSEWKKNKINLNVTEILYAYFR